MYLSSKQHDQLQIVVTNFEIPLRSYISTEIVKKYPQESIFSTEISSRTNLPTTVPNYQTINSELGKIKKEPRKYFEMLLNAKNAKEMRIVKDDIDVPNITMLIALTIIFKELFSPYLINYKDEETYLIQALKYKYVRNKLDHRGCKTLELSDMTISLDFISNALLFFNNDESLFWEKNIDEFSKELKSLQTSTCEIPINIHNLYEMPFPDMKIVCRNKEIEEIKEFIYGRPGALRKQSSYVLFGYGGVGKTALILEVVKQVVQDLQDNTTINGYKPDFLLFFTAKEEALTFSRTTGEIQNVTNRFSFKTAQELIQNIFTSLGISSYSNYNKNGLIIIDNLETLSVEERKRVEEFIRFNSPQQIQYIITSRNEENYENRKKIAGFQKDDTGQEFIKRYIDENNYDLDLSDSNSKTLLQISMGNTLVLVLCLRRLSLNLTTVNGIVRDISSSATIKKLENEIRKIPPNGFDIISEYMFKNSFQEMQENCNFNNMLLSSILKIFAVYPSETIDLSTISLLSRYSYSVIEATLSLLCRYLIVEKIGETYRLNPFAEKYIIQLFMPDSETYERIANEIMASTRRIQDELEGLQSNMDKNYNLKRIIQDWNVVTDGDKIAAAKAFKVYGDVKRDCETMNRFYISSSLRESAKTIETLEQNTMHPYVKYQKARILQLINDTGVLPEDFSSQIVSAYNDTIWTIKTNPLYISIRGTKSYASILWKYGIELSKNNTTEGQQSAARYLEESKQVFEQINDLCAQYYQCLVLLGRTYLNIYLLDRSNPHYLRLSRLMSKKLMKEKNSYYGKTRNSAAILREELLKFGTF